MNILREIGAALLLPFAAVKHAYDWLVQRLVGPAVGWLLRVTEPIIMPPLNLLGRFFDWMQRPIDPGPPDDDTSD